MNNLKKAIGLIIFLIISALSLTYVFAEGEAEKIGKKVSVREIRNDILKRKDGIFLDEFKDKEFDGCYGNQLSDDSRKVYDAFVQCIEKSTDGKSDLGTEHRKVTTGGEGEEAGALDLDVIYIDGKKFEDVNIDEDDEDMSKLYFVFYAMMAFDYDYPDVFWLDWEKIYIWPGATPEGRVWLNIYLCEDYENYYCSGYQSKENVESDRRKIEKICEEIHEKVEGMDTYSKADCFNRYLVQKNEYNRILLKTPAEEQKKLDGRLWKAVSAFIYGDTNLENPLNPVCEGYSRAFKILCDYEEIECVLVSGLGFTSEDVSIGNHMWNYVKIPNGENEGEEEDGEGKWYGVDVTWNDPVGENYESIPEEDFELNINRYFLIGYEKMKNGNEDNSLDKHAEEMADILFEGVKGLSYPVLEAEDYIYNPKAWPERVYILGDVNEDTFIDMADAAVLIGAVLDREGADYEYVKRTGDINGDGILTAEDAAMLIDSVLKTQEDTKG